MRMYQSTINTSWNEQAGVLADFSATQCSPEFLKFLAGHLEARLYPKGKTLGLGESFLCFCFMPLLLQYSIVTSDMQGVSIGGFYVLKSHQQAPLGCSWYIYIWSISFGQSQRSQPDRKILRLEEDV